MIAQPDDPPRIPSRRRPRSGGPVGIRVAVREDAPAVQEVLCASIMKLCAADHHHDAGTLTAWLENKTQEKIISWIDSAHTHAVVAHSGTRVCGVGLLEKSGDLRLCYVRPGWQNLGVGRAMMAALESQAGHWGLSEIRLTSASAARSFYEHLGYEPDDPPANPFGVLIEYPYRKSLNPKPLETPSPDEAASPTVLPP